MKHFFSLFLVIIPYCIFAQNKTPNPLETNNVSKNIPIDTSVVRGQLSNGLKFYIRENNKPKDKVYLRLIVNTGHLNEDENQLGLAHLLEHMGFNGTKHFKKDKLVKYIEHIGMSFGSDLNASTGNYQTIYKLAVPTKDIKQLDKAFQILEDWAHGMLLEEDAINAERPVVLEEFRRRLGSGNRIRTEKSKFMYEGIPHLAYYSDDKLKNIANFETSHLRRFYKEWYRPNLMGVVVVGNIDPVYVENKIKTHFSKLKNPESSKPFNIVDSIPYHKGTKVKIITDPEQTQTYIELNIIDEKAGVRRGTKQKNVKDIMVRNMVTSMVNNRLKAIYNSPDSPFLRSSVRTTGTISKAFGKFSALVNTDETTIETGLKHIILELERVKRFGFTKEELQRAKEKITASNEVLLEQKDEWKSYAYLSMLSSEFSGDWLLFDKDWMYNFYKTTTPLIALNDVNAMFNSLYKKDNRVLFLVAPEKETLKLPTKETLLEIIRDAEARTDITPYKPKVLGKALIKTLRPKGEILSEEEKLYDIKRLVLSNGATVLFKKTDFDKDKVMFKAVSQGGTSLMSDTLYKSVGKLLQLATTTGIGGFKSHELQELLTGKKVKLNTYVFEYEEGLKGTARTKDLETLFQLIYLNFTSVNYDETIYLDRTNKIKSYNKNRKMKPSSEFYSAINEVMQDGNPRYINMSNYDVLERLIDSISYDDVHEAYTERFANAGDFDFIFVGDFEEDLLKEFAETYLASLPSTHDEREVFKTSSFKNSLEDEKLVVYKGLEDKATIRMLFEAEASFDKDENAAFKIFAEIYKIRLRDRIREEKGGVYTIKANLKHIKRPFPKYSAIISFTCDPENIDDLEQETLNVLEELLKTGPTKKEVEQIKKKWILAREKAVEKNKFWLNYMYNKTYWGKPYRKLTDYEKSLSQLTPKYIKSVAEKYIEKPILTAKLLPEKLKVQQ